MTLPFDEMAAALLVRLLLAYEANPKAKSEKGETALDMARSRNHSAVVALLERLSK